MAYGCNLPSFREFLRASCTALCLAVGARFALCGFREEDTAMTARELISSRRAESMGATYAIDQPLLDWFAKRGWTATPYQREVWRRYLDGESGLLHTPTGGGK